MPEAYPIPPASVRSNRERSLRLPVDAAAATDYLKIMPIKPLVILPDPILRDVSKPVERVDDDVRRLAADMLETMYDAPGIGLAAIQVGVPLRMLVMDLSKEDEPRAPHIVINPEILAASDARNVHEEGCLSIPDYYAEVERPATIRLRFLDDQGERQEMEADGLAATCLQHEIDHLNGILFIDHISRLKRDMVVRKFKKLAKDSPPGKLVG
jgi:peptide deformylase